MGLAKTAAGATETDKQGAGVKADESNGGGKSRKDK